MPEKTSWNSAAMTESDINTYLTHWAGAWRPWKVTATQLNGLPIETIRGRSWKAGRLVVADGMVKVQARGITGQDISIDLPYAAASGPHAARDLIGSAVITDVGPGIIYPVMCGYYSSTAFCFVNSNGNLMGSDTYFLPDPGDIFTFTLMYEAAS
jgi:hypothetical protein